MDERGNLITEKQAKMIAHVLHEIRPAWGIEGTLKVLDRNKDHTAPFGDILAAAVCAARDPSTQTPGRIFEVRIHWPATIRAQLPKPPSCEDHIGQDAYTCRSCHADIKAGERPESMLGKRWNPPDTNESEIE